MASNKKATLLIDLRLSIDLFLCEVLLLILRNQIMPFPFTSASLAHSGLESLQLSYILQVLDDNYRFAQVIAIGI